MAFDAGTGFVDILPAVNPLAFNAALSKQITPALNTVGSRVSAVTSKLGAALSTPLGATAGIGIVASLGKLTISFEDAFTRISALSNASAEDIGRWKGQVLSLAGETAIAPQELAEALFFLSSAGLKASDVFPALEAAAKGAATGLGTTADVANIAASAMNAYASSGLTAASVTDTLVAAVREGRAAPDEFADAMGRILPIAARAGVSFDEVAASLAVLSNIGLDVDEGVTAMRGLLQALVAPGSQAAKALDNVGISTEQMRKVLAEGGLLAALELLEERTKGNLDVLRPIIPNVRSLTGELGLMGENAAKNADIFDRVAHAVGDASVAFDETAKGPGFRFRQAFVRIQEVMIRLGKIALPVANTVAGAFITITAPLVKLLDVLIKLPGLTVALTTALAGFAIAKFVPNLLLAIGVGLERLGIAAAANAAVTAGVAFETFGLTLLRLAPLALIPAAAFKLASIEADRSAKGLEAARDSIVKFGSDSKRSASDVQTLTRAIASEHGVTGRFGATAEEHERAAAAIDKELGRLDALHEKNRIVTTDLEVFQQQVHRTFGPAAEEVARFIDQPFSDFSKDLRAALGEAHLDLKKWNTFVAATMSDAREVFEEFQSSAAEQLDFVGGALSEMASNAQSATDELANLTSDSTLKPAALADLRDEAHLTAIEILKGFKDARRETQAFGRDLLIISRTGGEAGKDLAADLLAMGPAGAAAADTIAGAGEKMREKIIRAFGAGKDAAEDLATRLTRRIVGTLETIRDILDAIARRWGIDIDTNADKAKSDIDSVYAKLLKLDGTSVSTSIIVRRVGGGTEDPRQIGGEHGFYIPGAQHGAVITREQFIRVGEHSKDEMLLPLEDESGHRKLVRALRDAGAGGSDAGAIAQAVAGAVAGALRGASLKMDRDGVVRIVTQGQERRRSLVGA